MEKNIIYNRKAAEYYVGQIEKYYSLFDNEREEMVELLTEIGLDVDDIFNETALQKAADYYEFAEKVTFTPEEMDAGVNSEGDSVEDLEGNYLFRFQTDDGDTVFVISW